MHRTITKIETPPLSIEAADAMRNAVTVALRAYADNLNIQHDYEAVRTAAIPYMQWEKMTLDSGNIVLQLRVEVVIKPKPQAVAGESHIAFLKRVDD